MAMSMSKGIDLQDLWDVLLANQTTPGALGSYLRYGQYRNFYDEFRRGAVNAAVWTEGGDDGAWAPGLIAGESSCWRLLTGAVLNQDRYIVGIQNVENGFFSIDEEDADTVTWMCRAKFVHTTNIACMYGMMPTPQLNYVEPVIDCAHFFIDTAIGNNYICRTYNAAAEEQTDSGIAIDTDYHVFAMIWTAASVLFYIDGALVATHAVTVPDQPMGTGITLRTLEAAAKEMRIDYIRVEVS